MAVTNLSGVSVDALAQIFDPKLARQWNRSAKTLSMLNVKEGGGKNVAWDALTSVQTAATYTEGSDVDPSEFLTDLAQPAILPWGLYRNAFGLSDHAIQVAKSSMGNAVELQDLVQESAFDSVAGLASKLNVDLFAATGSGSSLVGLSSALGTSSTYATIDRGTYTEWASTVLSNSGTPRALTTALMDIADGYISMKSGMSPDFIVCHPTIFRKYKSQFTVSVFNVGQPLKFDESATEDNVTYQGIPVIRDKDCPSTKLFMINRSALELVYLAPEVDEDSIAVLRMAGGNGDGLVDSVGLPVKMSKLSKTGNARKFVLNVTLQLKVRRPNCMAVITDLDAS
jgi:hypothetical protein